MAYLVMFCMYRARALSAIALHSHLCASQASEPLRTAYCVTLLAMKAQLPLP